MINPEMSVSEVAIKIPEATKLLEKLKIDYCCGGKRPFADACASAGIEMAQVVRMLEELSGSEPIKDGMINFQNTSLYELIAYILDKHHVYTKEAMTRLDALMKKVILAHGQNHPELHEIGKLFETLCADLRPHMFKEEQILFPYISELERAGLEKREAPFAPFGTVNNPIRMMMMEHDAAGQILRDLRAVSSDYTVPADACISYRTLYQAMEELEKDLHEHIHLENNILFPRASEQEAK
jgi:regulator of cell morphogenesis and NO signaling